MENINSHIYTHIHACIHTVGMFQKEMKKIEEEKGKDILIHKRTKSLVSYDIGKWGSWEEENRKILKETIVHS